MYHVKVFTSSQSSKIADENHKDKQTTAVRRLDIYLACTSLWPDKNLTFISVCAFLWTLMSLRFCAYV